MIAGVGVVALTGWERLDPLIALVVAANIVFTGVRLVRRSSGGLMDHALAPAEQAALDAALAPYRDRDISFRAIRNRQAGRRSFVSMHVLVPGRWTIQHGLRRHGPRPRASGYCDKRSAMSQAEPPLSPFTYESAAVRGLPSLPAHPSLSLDGLRNE